MRGYYDNINRGRQLLLFDGFRYGNITPTDFDAVMEYDDRLWIMFEAKMKGKKVPFGQQLALERWVRDAKLAGKHAIALITDHEVYDPREDVHLKDCSVRKIFTSEDLEWREPRMGLTAKQAADIYLEFYDKLK